jgi:hypothetical protein
LRQHGRTGRTQKLELEEKLEFEDVWAAMAKRPKSPSLTLGWSVRGVARVAAEGRVIW